MRSPSGRRRENPSPRPGAARSAFVVDLERVKIALLDVLAEHLDKTRDDTVARVLDALFVATYRPDG